MHSDAQRIKHLVVGGGRAAHEQIVADGAAHEGIALGHVDKVATHTRRQLLAVSVGVVEVYLSLLGTEQGEDEAANGAAPCS